MHNEPAVTRYGNVSGKSRVHSPQAWGCAGYEHVGRAQTSVLGSLSPSRTNLNSEMAPLVPQSTFSRSKKMRFPLPSSSIELSFSCHTKIIVSLIICQVASARARLTNPAPPRDGTVPRLGLTRYTHRRGTVPRRGGPPPRARGQARTRACTRCGQSTS